MLLLGFLGETTHSKKNKNIITGKKTMVDFKKHMKKEKGKVSKPKKETSNVSAMEQEVNADLPETRIQDVYKNDKSIQLTLENATVIKGNLNKPYHSKEYDSYSSSITIEISEDLKKALYDLLASHFKNQKGLQMALENFLTKKVSQLDNGVQAIYASVKWVKANGKLTLSKALPVSGISGKFPFSFIGDIRIGIVYSIQHTFSIYLNGVIVHEVLKQESDFVGFSADSEFNPSVEVSEEAEQEIENAFESEKAVNSQNGNGKTSWKDKIWGKK